MPGRMGAGNPAVVLCVRESVYIRKRVNPCPRCSLVPCLLLHSILPTCGHRSLRVDVDRVCVASAGQEARHLLRAEGLRDLELLPVAEASDGGSLIFIMASARKLCFCSEAASSPHDQVLASS